MNRRFFITALSGFLSTVGLGFQQVFGSGFTKQRVFYRLEEIRPGYKEYVPRKLSEIKNKDRFLISDGGKITGPYFATSDSFISSKDSIRTIEVSNCLGTHLMEGMIREKWI